MDKQEQRVADAVGPSLSAGETTSATIDHPKQEHDGHLDVFDVSKSNSGKVTTEKQHATEGKGGFWNW